MNVDRNIWRSWAAILHRWGIADLAATFLDAAGPLNLLSAQIIYLSQPILSAAFQSASLSVLAEMLETPGETRAFANYLREGI